MSKSSKGAGCFWVVAALALAGTVAALTIWPHRWWSEPAQLMPAGSMGFAEVNVAEVIASPLWTAFDSEEAAGRREEISSICGVDPLEVVEDVSVGWVRQEASLEAVVVFMRADIPLEAVQTCMDQVLESSGRGVRIVDVARLPALAGDQGDSRLVWLGGGWIVFGSENTVRPIAEASRARPEVDGPWAVTPETPVGVFEGAQVRLRMQIPAEFGDASFLSHGIVAGAGRRVIGMMESAEGGLKLDEAEAIRWAFEVKPRGEEGATMLRTGLDAWRLAVRALGGDGLLGEMLGDLSAVERGDGLLVEGRVGYETLIQALPSGNALR